MHKVYDPLTAAALLLAGEVSTLCADYLDWTCNWRHIKNGSVVAALIERSQSLDDRSQRLVERIPLWLRPGQVPKSQHTKLPSWIAELINDARAPDFIHTYTGFGLCLLWNMIRFCRMRLHQVLLELSAVSIGSLIPPYSIMTLLELQEAVCSTVCAILLTTEEKEIGRGTTAQELSSFRSFVLVRCLLPLRTALRFLVRWGIPVQERLTWLEELCLCLQKNMVILIPPEIDPLARD